MSEEFIMCKNIDTFHRDCICKISDQKCIREIADDADICDYFERIFDVGEFIKKEMAK